MIETRATGGRVTSEGRTIKGLASPTWDGTPGTQYELMPGVVERFAAGAFDEHLRASPDVVCCLNHNPDAVLARTPDTLRVRSDARGLHYEADVADTGPGRDLLVSVARGDIRGSSFAFRALTVEWLRDGPLDVRLIRAASLHDVSPTTLPAYGSSTVGLRSEERRAIEAERADFHGRLETERRLARLEQLTGR